MAPTKRGAAPQARGRPDGLGRTQARLAARAAEGLARAADLADAKAALARVHSLASTVQATSPELAQMIRDAISPGVPAEPVLLAGQYEIAAWLSGHAGATVAPYVVQQALVRNPNAPAPPQPTHKVVNAGGREVPAWDITPVMRRLWTDWWDSRPGRGNGLRGPTRRKVLPDASETGQAG